MKARVKCPSCHAHLPVVSGEAHCVVCQRTYRVKGKSIPPKKKLTPAAVIAFLWILLLVVVFWRWV
jgi:hypothetical protein